MVFLSAVASAASMAVEKEARSGRTPAVARARRSAGATGDATVGSSVARRGKKMVDGMEVEWAGRTADGSA